MKLLNTRAVHICNYSTSRQSKATAADRADLTFVRSPGASAAPIKLAIPPTFVSAFGTATCTVRKGCSLLMKLGDNLMSPLDTLV